MMRLTKTSMRMTVRWPRLRSKRDLLCLPLSSHQCRLHPSPRHRHHWWEDYDIQKFSRNKRAKLLFFSTYLKSPNAHQLFDNALNLAISRLLERSAPAVARSPPTGCASFSIRTTTKFGFMSSPRRRRCMINWWIGIIIQAWHPGQIIRSCDVFSPGQGAQALVALPDDAGGGDRVRPVLVPGNDFFRPGDLLLRRNGQGSPGASLRRLRWPDQGLLQVRESWGGFELGKLGFNVERRT